MTLAEFKENHPKLFATSSPQGPYTFTALADELRQADMLACAWMVEEMIDRIDLSQGQLFTFKNFSYLILRTIRA